MDIKIAEYMLKKMALHVIGIAKRVGNTEMDLRLPETIEEADKEMENFYREDLRHKVLVMGSLYAIVENEKEK